MGVTISHKLGANKIYIKSILDQAEQVANFIKKEAIRTNLAVSIRRMSDTSLLIDISGCETLGFVFQSASDFIKNHTYLSDVRDIEEGYMSKEYPQNEKWYCYDFCKTQYAGNIIAHKWVADLIKVVASRCFYSYINDERDYYYSGKLEDAGEAIKDNGTLINNLMGKFKDLGHDVITPNTK